MEYAMDDNGFLHERVHGLSNECFFALTGQFMDPSMGEPIMSSVHGSIDTRHRLLHGIVLGLFRGRHHGFIHERCHGGSRGIVLSLIHI